MIPAVLDRIRADRRWDEVVTIRVLPGRPGGQAPLDRIGLGPATSMIRAAVPGARIVVERWPMMEPADCLARMHARLTGRGGLGADEVLLAESGPHLVLAHSHRYGDGPTMQILLAPLRHGVRGGAGPVAPARWRRPGYPLPLLVAAAARGAVTRPAAVRAALQTAAGARRPATTGAAAGAPADSTGGASPAAPAYRITEWTWAATGPRPGGLELAARWRVALSAALPAGTLDPRGAWVNVGLRRADPRLEGCAGNFMTRIRLAPGPDPDSAAAATRDLVVSGYPLLRAGASAAVQGLRQLAGPDRSGPVPVPGPGAPAPRRGLATSWSHNRVDVDAFGEFGCPAVPPGGIAVAAYQCGDRLRILLSCHVAADLGATIEETTAGLLRAAGYREEPGR